MRTRTGDEEHSVAALKLAEAGVNVDNVLKPPRFFASKARGFGVVEEIDLRAPI
jgi:hypothetical protein